MPLPDLDNEISELHSDEILIQITAQEQDLDRADALANLQAEITQAGAISRQDVMTAEAIAPGVLLDNYPRGGWTEERSTQNLKVSLEFMDKKMAVFAGIGVLGLLAAILRFFLKKDKSSDSSSGGGGVSSRDITEAATATTAGATSVTTAAHDMINAFTAHPHNIDAATSKKFHALLLEVNVPVAEADKLVANDAELRSWMRSKFMKQMVFSLVGDDLSNVIIDSKAHQVHTHMAAMLTNLNGKSTGLVESLSLITTYLTDLTKAAKDGTSLVKDWPTPPPLDESVFKSVADYLVIVGHHDATSLAVANRLGIAEALNKHISGLGEKLTIDSQRAYTDTLKDVTAFEAKVQPFLEGPGIKARELVETLEKPIEKLVALVQKTDTDTTPTIPGEHKAAYKAALDGVNDYVKAGGKVITAIAILSNMTVRLMAKSSGRLADYIRFEQKFKDLSDYIGKP